MDDDEVLNGLIEYHKNNTDLNFIKLDILNIVILTLKAII